MATTTSGRDAAALLVRAAPVVFVLIWATGFVVAKYAAPHAEPLSFLLVRYAGVVVLMLVLALVARARWPRGWAVWHLAVAGVGIQAGYLGGVWAAVAAGMPAGVAALVVNLQPVLTAAVAGLTGARLGRLQVVGLVLGFLGVVLVVSSKLTTTGITATTLGLTTLALLTITTGTLYQKRFCPQFDLRTGQVVQFAASIVVTLPFALAFESFRLDWTPELIGALVWSVVVLTGGGISLLFLMLRRGAATQVTSYFYLVPGVTALLALVMFGEVLGPFAIAGMVVAVLGVALATRAGPGSGGAPPAAPQPEGERAEDHPGADDAEHHRADAVGGAATGHADQLGVGDVVLDRDDLPR
ncbi:DMT family transporter [Pseudonocardia sp. KRD-184]|uniref:DMT family transporter n=1 Tax=Pseudonocardia oceani TaxID=2792013 RepID=A0ABS6U7A2_9PSEU|nr:DMT family transporter [Pseudonocardia oceani]MBW0097729.1 DMT family transporter [Pseudonocardia oceani]MBW0110245.1 DMT family transporter [Pseudonocardia oceani]MBW0122903.1 DMT family transporter [Pseudonocardia oceani]MBW0128109.1 DMT family transporter [Pseudonocardia oceani]